MWFLYVNGAYIGKTVQVEELLALLRILMDWEDINTIELRPEKEF